MLLLNCILSSCGNKDKDKSNDFTIRTTLGSQTRNHKESKSYSEFVDALLRIHLSSCTKLSDECSKAQRKDPKHLNPDLWQNCLNSELSCPNGEESFTKVHLDCITSELDCRKSYQSCYEARRSCPDSALNCPGTESVCALNSAIEPKNQLNCPAFDCHEANPICDKVDSLFSDVGKICSHDKFPKACNEALLSYTNSLVSCLEAEKSCLESELNDTKSS